MGSREADSRVASGDNSIKELRKRPLAVGRVLKFFCHEGPDPEDPMKQLYRAMEWHGTGTARIERAGKLYRKATDEERTREDAVTILDSDTFDFIPIVPVE